MRVIVFSDTHGNRRLTSKIFENNPTVKLFIFLGDLERDIESFQNEDKRKILSVSGNCDFGSFNQKVGTTFVEGKKIIFLHGHQHNVKSGLLTLDLLARENCADIILFGHTHCRHYSYHNGIHFLNPGSVGEPRDGKKPSYAFIDITSAGIVANHVDIK